MFAKRKVLFGVLMAAGFFADAAAAKPVDVIRPEDEAILEGIFDVEGQNAKPQPSPMADGHGVEMKGVRDATRIKAQPLNVTFGKNEPKTASQSSSQVQEVTEPKVRVSTADDAEMVVEVNDGANLKDTMKTVVEGTPAATKQVETVVSTATVSESDSESLKSNVSSQTQHEIGYTYPSKVERAEARQPLREWYDPNLGKEAPSIGGEPKKDMVFESYRQAIADCLDSKEADLEVDRGMLYRGNMYDAAAYLSQNLADVNACYENIGYDIIRVYYNDEPRLKERFAKDVQDFYITGTDVNFSPKFCGEDCSMESMLDAQMAKFADFRTYLGKLLAERPVQEPLEAPMIDVASGTQAPETVTTESVDEIQYDEDGVPFIDAYLEEDEENTASVRQETRQPSLSRSQRYERAVSPRTPAARPEKYELPEIM